MKKNESKYLYTARLMNQAILSLLEKKDLEFITVTEITRKAGVNRSTFYLHYDNVYDLFEEAVENLNKEFLLSFGQNVSVEIKTKEDAFLITEKYLIPYLNFCKENKRILKLVHKKPGVFSVSSIYSKMYEKIFYPAISQFIKDEERRIYVLEYFIKGVVGIIHKWIELDCNTEIEKLIRIIKDCLRYQYMLEGSDY